MKRKNFILLSLLILGIMMLTGCGKSYTVTGQIVDLEGKGLKDVQVVFSGGTSGVATTDASGNWRMDRVKGTVTITPKKEDWAFAPASTSVSEAAENIKFDGVLPLLLEIQGRGTVTVYSATAGTATFQQSESGPVLAHPKGSGYQLGEEVTLTRKADTGWKFSHWADDFMGSEESFRIPMNGPKKITAVFIQTAAEISFADANLEQAVRKAVNKPTGSITRKDVEQLTYLNASVMPIKTLKGIEGLSGLTWLDLSITGTLIVDDLSPLTNLEYLNLGTNQIIDIKAVNRMAKLKELRLNNNKITDISQLSWLAEKSLTNLDLGNNQVVDLKPVQNITSLERLVLVNNKVADITPLAKLVNLTELDLSFNLVDKIATLKGMKRLQKLNLQKNKLTSIDDLILLNDGSLRELNVKENQIALVTKLGELRTLEKLNLANNLLGTQVVNAIAPDPLEPISKLTNLRELDLSGNQIKDISKLATLTSVEVLHLHKNLIEDISPLLQLTSLKKVTLMDNKLNLSRGLPTWDAIEALQQMGVVVIYDYYQNDAPIIEYPTTDMTVNENQELRFTVRAVDPNRDAMTYSAKEPTTNKVKLVPKFNTTTHEFVWTPTYDDAGEYEITFSVSDGEIASTVTVKITVNNVNRAPVFTPALTDKQVQETSTLTFKVAAVDPDGDTATITKDPTERMAQYFDEATLTFTWTPGYTDAGEYPLTLTTTDGVTAYSQTIKIIVTNKNRPPRISYTGVTTVNENVPMSLEIIGEDDDSGDPLTYTAEGPFKSFFTPQTRIFAWTPTFEQAGIYTMIFTVSDGSLSASVTVNITVLNVDRPPVISPAIGDQYVDEYSTLSFSVKGVDPDGDVVSYSSVNLPTGATLNAATGAFSWRPEYQHIGEHQVTFIVSSKGKTATEIVTITVNDRPFSPTIKPIGNKEISEGQTLTIFVDAEDLDRETIKCYATGDFISQYFDPATRTFTWTPPYDTTTTQRVYPITFYAEAGGETVSQAITITVKNTNQKPSVILSGKYFEVEELSTIKFNIVGSDPDGETVYITVKGTFSTCYNPVTKEFTWTPGYFDGGNYPNGKDHIIEIVANDGKDSVTEFVTVKVYNKDRPPVLSLSPQPVNGVYTIDEYSKLRILMVGYDEDLETITYSVNNAPTGSTVDATNGVFEWTPTKEHLTGGDPLAPGTYDVTFIATSNNVQKPVSAKIKVNNVEFAPIFTSPVADVNVPNRSSITVNEGQSVSFQITAEDRDSDPVTYAISYGDNATQTLLSPNYNADTRTFNWVTNYDVVVGAASRTFNMTVSANDGKQTTLHTITITVNNVDREPLLSVSSNLMTVLKDAPQNVIIDARDLDGDAITLTASILSSSILPIPTTLSQIGAQLTYDPATGKGSLDATYNLTATGTHVVRLMASAGGKAITRDVTIKVQGAKLTVTSFSVGTDTVIEPHESMLLSATVRNDGNIDSGPFMVVWQVFQGENFITQFNTNVVVNSLAANGGSTSAGEITATLNGSFMTGAGLSFNTPYYIKAVANPTNDTNGNAGGPANSMALEFKLIKAQYALTLNVSEGGRISANPLPDANGKYSEGDVVTLTALPNPGWMFDRWEGDLTGTTMQQTITINANKTVNAYFKKIRLGRKLAYISNEAKSSGEIYLMYEDGSIVRVTNNDLQESTPRWSSDGSKLIFDAYDPSTGRTDIYIYHVPAVAGTSSIPQNMTQFVNNNTHKSPAFSPDGSLFAYASNEAGSDLEIYIRRTADGSLIDKPRVTGNVANDDFPVWSPDGEMRIVCVSANAGESQGVLLMYTLEGNSWVGRSLNQDWYIAPKAAKPVWSADKRFIAYEYNSNIFTVEFTGDASNICASWKVTQVTTMGLNKNPAWSSGSNLLAYESDRATPGKYDIYVASLAGSTFEGTGSSAARYTATNNISETNAKWASDGTMIYVGTPDGEKRELYMVDLQSAHIRLTYNSVEDYGASWSPI